MYTALDKRLWFLCWWKYF